LETAHANGTINEMATNGSKLLTRVLSVLAILLVWKVTLSVVAGYTSYLPPDFGADFLLGRESYFWGGYQWACYTHIASGPVSLLLGTVLINDRFRNRFPAWHRRLGRFQGMCILLLVAPSGLWMAQYAAAGPFAAAGLGSLAVATAACVSFGWRSAVKRRFAEHRRWMYRTFLLLSSAVVIRLIGGLATVAGYNEPWVNAFSVWASWLGPLAVFEAVRWWHAPAKTPFSTHPPAGRVGFD